MNCLVDLMQLENVQKKNKIRILIDAEQTYRQPAIDVMAIYLSNKYNVDTPIFYNTYQFYLKRTPEVFLQHKKLAEEGNYFFAAKCVRGAYIPSETVRANELKYDLPIVDSKEKTDLAYNFHTKLMLDEVEKKKESSPGSCNAQYEFLRNFVITDQKG